MRRLTYWAAVLLSGVTLCGCGESGTSSQLSQLISEIKELREMLARQERLLRSLGADPEFNSGAVETAISRLEAVFREQKSDAIGEASADALRDELQKIFDALSPLQQEAWLRRTLSLQWNIEATRVLASFRVALDAGSENADWESLVERIESLQIARPAGTLDALAEELDRRLGEVESRLEAERTRSAVELAQALLSEQHREGLDAAWLALDALSEQSEDVRTLKWRLRAAALDAECEDQCHELQNRLTRLRAVSEPELQQAGLSQVFEAALTLKLELLFADDPHTSPQRESVQRTIETLVAETRRELQASARRAEESNQQKVRKYQQWALDQIARFNARSHAATTSETGTMFASFKSATEEQHWPLLDEFEEVAVLVSEKTGVRIDRSNPKRGMLSPEQQNGIHKSANATFGWNHLEDIAQLTSREAAIRYLLPIESSLLEPPVQQLYSKAFQTAWTSAESSGHQLEIAKRTVTVKKKSLSDF